MKYVIANWKMKMGMDDIRSWYEKFSELLASGSSSGQLSSVTAVRIIIAPSFVHLPIVKEVFKDLNINLAAQDIAEFDKGAHTGYVGGFQLKEFSEYAITGHSERKEDTATVQKKRDLALQSGLTPIVCFTQPETASDRYSDGVMMAWEDPDNISVNGEYRPKDPADINKGAKNLAALLPKDAILIYGGSVNKDNISDLSKMADIDGVLVGNASLDPEHFFEIIVKFTA